MNISFDLDGMLIPSGEEFETERRGRIAKIFGVEKLRKGAPELIQHLQAQGHNIHIYTTSFRSKRSIRKTLRYYKINVRRIVNQTENLKVLKSQNIYASKYPPAFYFDLHIDDSKGVAMEGKKYNFKTIVVEPSDNHWVKKIKIRLEKYL